MTFTREQRQIAYKKLPPEVQDLIMSNETTELITNAIKEVGLSSEQANLADSEILYAMFCMQSLDDAINNIANFSLKDKNALSKFKSTVQDNILSKYKIDISEFVAINKSKLSEAPPIPVILPISQTPRPEKERISPEESFKTLPEVMQKAINAVPWRSSVQEIAFLNKLSLEHVASVEGETMSVIYGSKNRDSYIKNIISEAKIDETTANNIANAVDEKIFKVISRKAAEFEKLQSPIFTNSSIGIPPANLPMVEKGEVVHDAVRVQFINTPPAPKSMEPRITPPPIVVREPEIIVQKTERVKVPVPDYRYPAGKDPYKEPLV